MRPTAVQLSFRLGGADGVAVEARKWEWALHELGFDVRRVAGELDDGFRPDDTWLPFLAIDPPPGARPAAEELAVSLAGADLVVVENLCSLPINPTASVLAARVLDDHPGRVVFRHHDLPWQRPHLAQVDGIPPRRPLSLHVTTNDLSRRELAARGIVAVTIRLAFDLDPAPGHRDATRRVFDFDADDVVLVQPTRAIPRKNMPGAIRFGKAVAALMPERVVKLWLTGPAEDGYGPELDHLIATAGLPTIVGRATSAADVYAAAELVVLASTWEGFGLPVAEAIAFRKPLAVGHYPALDELTAFGLELLSIDRPEEAVAGLRSGLPVDLLERNVDRLRTQCSLERLPDRLATALAAQGWTDW
jgi:hypothetical protein